jgi:serine/threonine protein kinase
MSKIGRPTYLTPARTTSRPQTKRAMANRAHGLAFPSPNIYEAERNFTMQLVDGRLIEGYVRRRDANYPVAYIATKPGPRMAPGKGRLFYGYAFTRNSKGRYQIDNNNPIVIKKLRSTWNLNHPHDNVFNEMYVAQALGDDSYIARTRDTLMDERYYYIIMPLLGADLVDSRKYFELPYPTITRQLLRNLRYIRQFGILHCDVSAENAIVYVNDDNQVQCPFIDFAMAIKCAKDANGRYLQVIREDARRLFGKLRYMSPEICYGSDIHFGVDVWAIGCMLFFLWTGHFLYLTPGDACWNYFVLRLDQLPRHTKVTETLNLWEQLSHTQQNLLTRIFQFQPDSRATIEELLNHPYVAHSY